ncbi:MAG: leucine-rich repeat protein, partial [Clostridia bacterium]|nr:leucine-rich repeat protein [Clostridia bacterium]
MMKKSGNKKLYIAIAAVAAVTLIVLLVVLLSKCGGERTTDPTGAPASLPSTVSGQSAQPTSGAESSSAGAPSDSATAEPATVDPTVETPSEPVHKHTFGPWTVLTEPTCLTPGEHERTCTECGYVQKEEMAPLGHDGQNNECVRCGKKALTAEHLKYEPYPYGDGLWIKKIIDLDDPDVLIPDVIDGKSVICVPSDVFIDNETVETISLPDSVTQLGTFTFYRCPNLRMIRFGRKIGNQYTAVAGFCPKIDYLVVPPENTLIHSDHNCVIETETKTMLHGCRNSIIPDDGSVLILANTAFFDCTGLTSIVIPSPVTTITECAFNSCYDLVSVEISDSVTTLEENVFIMCKSLKNVRLPAHLTMLENELFEFCSALEE